MGYITEEEIDDIFCCTITKIVDENTDLSEYDFNCGVSEYDLFLKNDAKKLSMFNIGQTHLLIHKDTGILLGYITLCSDCIKLSKREKQKHLLEDISFMYLPSLKVGKLATNKEIIKEYNKTNDIKLPSKIGSFLLEYAKVILDEINEGDTTGVACRFITVDADVEHNKENEQFYIDN